MRAQPPPCRPLDLRVLFHVPEPPSALAHGHHSQALHPAPLSRRIVGFGVQGVAVDGPALCRLFNQAMSGQGPPIRLSFDHDPLFEFQRWQANLRVLGVEAVQPVPSVPWSHPFVERLIGTIRREYLDHLLFWNAEDLERKLDLFRRYYNGLRVHQGLEGDTPDEKAGSRRREPIRLVGYTWQSHCHGLFELSIAA